MKVVCIYNSNNSLSLTIGKVYDTSNSDYSLLYEIKNDDDVFRSYFKTRFIALKEYRKKKLEKLNSL